ncbi:TetR/AcrR family transcriptional regulator [Rhodococcus chondri]|uniref:TetR/AcrR family transcriptional regulator n=1 Tax=Rhodococcus chondri TaxID=3065941 RepID=A0ABU7JLQ7_9NOCA|nr:TetR/AcrR family transcriptional regulator [Rhodococcus sp. CC-R104]MEE2030962.1 TetR/AcrR family transcriptional regulator [Rhodococcus sp. CC-R104]
MSSSSSQIGRPVGAKSEETRRRILASAMRCVAEVGYSRATIREIARLAGITSGSLYHYFPNKAEIVKAAFTEIADVSLPRLAAAADRTPGVLNQILAVLDEGGQLLRDNPHAVAFDRALRVESAEHLHLDQDSDMIYMGLRAVIRRIIEQSHREGTLTADADIDGTTDAIFAIFQGLSDHAATATPEQYRATSRAIALLIRGSLFDPAPGAVTFGR